MENTEFLESYGFKHLRKIGVGPNTTVFRAEHSQKDGKKITLAIKMLMNNDKGMHEVNILMRLSHPNILGYFDYLRTFRNIYIFTEFCELGDLEQFLGCTKKILLPVVKSLVQDISCALQYLQRQSIGHFDVAPSNIFLCARPSLVFKLGDFGVARGYNLIVSEDNLSEGLIEYKSPERLAKTLCDMRSDIWSLGVIMYTCIFPKPNYETLPQEELISLMCTNNHLWHTTDHHLPQDCLDLLHQLTKFDPDRRIRIHEFVGHEFLLQQLVSNVGTICAIQSHCNDAVIGELTKKYHITIKNLREATVLLEKHVKNELNGDKRKYMKNLIEEFRVRINEIKKNTLMYPSWHPTFKIKSPEGYLELQKLSEDDPEILKVIRRAIDAELLIMKNEYATAFETLQQALIDMQNISLRISKGRKRNLILSNISRWEYTIKQLDEALGH